MALRERSRHARIPSTLRGAITPEKVMALRRPHATTLSCRLQLSLERPAWRRQHQPECITRQVKGRRAPMPDYRYELRRGDQVLATGHLSWEQALEVGERVTIGVQSGVVQSIEPLLYERELRLIVQLERDHSAA
jgi:hypothetical protein